MPIIRNTLLAIAAAAALAACDSAEERAEEHYQSALELVEAGDYSRALVEFRNVFQLNAQHVEAREAYANVLLENGNLRGAYRAFLQVAEQQPSNLEVRERLAHMAILRGDWEEVDRHGQVLAEANAETPDARIVDLARRFRDAVADENEPAVRELTREAEDLRAEAPEDEVLMRLLLDGYMADQNMEAALAVTDELLAIAPNDPIPNEARLRILAAMNDAEGTEGQLRTMIERFPENLQTKQMLLRFLLSEDRSEDAKQFLRDEIERAEEPELRQDRTVDLINFVRQIEGPDAALSETEAAIAATEQPSTFQALKASLIFDQGEREEAVTLMQQAIDGTEDSDRKNRLEVGLARMLLVTGNETGAREIVGRVLESDPGNVEALKMRAAWQIEEDEATQAVNALRSVLDQAPNDADAMTLMAQAHVRNGDSELAMDMLSLAVEASNNGRDESLRFASALVQEDNLRPAEDVLIQALRRTPDDLELLAQLGQVYIGLEDYSRAEGVEQALRRLESEAGLAAADSLRLALIARREGAAEANAFLEGLAEAEGDVAVRAQIGLIRARLTEGDPAAALAIAEQLVAEDGENPSLQVVLANTQFAARDFAAAESTFRDVIEATGGNDRLWLQLIRTVNAQDRAEDASGLIKEGLERYPDSAQLRWALASELEQSNDIDGALEIYEELYAQNSNALIVANNLASLLATYRDDEESLERAWTVARRLRGTEVPAFQDTYGWIAFRRGNAEEAVEYLEPAAEGLPGDPIVQYHLGRALEAVGRAEDALTAYRRAIEIADEADTRTQIADAREAITRLESAGSE